MTNKPCPATLVIDYDSLWCTLPTGHEGMHLDYMNFYWMPTK